MANYEIHIDSSTKPVNKVSGYGKSTAAWTTKINGRLIRAGLIYSHWNGPNKILYEGLLAALVSLEPVHFHPNGTDNVKVFFDSETVIDQLNGLMNAVKMSTHRNIVQKFCLRHTNVTFEFLYKNERDPTFKKVDTLSKNGRTWMPKMI